MITIREAVIADAAAIQKINISSLDYHFPLDETIEQLKRILSLPNTKLFVAQNSNDEVLGYIQMSDYENTYHKSLKNIIKLAVSGKHQDEGIGSKLIEYAEDWAKKDGSYGIRLVSGFERESGHEFYEKHGYEIRKKEINYIKWWK